MIAHAADAEVKTAKSGDCGCGCGGQCGCEARCCDLECLVRPRFFCGQLLADTDLGTMVEWARQRFALTRYRDGWGAVCGLEVTCSSPGGAHACCPDGQTGGPTVYVNPGYAVDCCGNDLVVCDPIAVDLGKACRPLDDPCDRVPEWPQPRDPKPARPAGVAPADCRDIFRGELIAVDLFLRHHEDLAHAQRTMLRGGCSDVGACEYTRVLERPCVFPEPAVLDRDPREQDAKDWYEKFLGEFERTMKEISGVALRGPEAVLQYLRRHPPYQVCFLKELVCCLLDDAAQAKASMNRVAFWLYLDWVLRKLACPCGSCRPDRGVPLARVYLRRSAEGAEPCRLMLIDPSQRRAIRTDPCRPLRTGAIDLAPYLFKTRDALAQLRVSGVEAREATPMGEDQLWDVVASGKHAPRLSLESDKRVVQALLVTDPFGTDRVAAFRTADEGFV